MSEIRTIATGLQFPEGPVALADGSVLVVEIARATLSRVTPDGTVTVVAELGGGPNGAAIGPDGKCYITNNGGCFVFQDVMGMTVPGPVPPTWTGGSIQRVDLDTGEFETVYTASSSGPLCDPTIWCSMPTAGCGSPTMACDSTARAIAPVCTTPRSTGPRVSKWCIRSTRRTASASRPRGSVYDRSGVHMASVAQEGVMREIDPTKAPGSYRVIGRTPAGGSAIADRSEVSEPKS